MNHQECSVCFDEKFTQNVFLICAHPLCSYCFSKLKVHCCPICRSFKRYPMIPVSIIHNTKKHIMVREVDLIPFVLFSYDYHDFLRRHLKQRKSLEVFKKVTKYLGEDAFIIHKGEVIIYGELPIPKLFIFLMDNTFSKYNKEILKAFLRL